MIVIAFTDLHANFAFFKMLQAKIKKYEPSYVFCLGDLTIFEQNMENWLQKINSFGIPTFIIPGNHESENDLQKLCKKYSNLVFAHKQIIEVGNFCVVGHGGGGF